MAEPSWVRPETSVFVMTTLYATANPLQTSHLTFSRAREKTARLRAR